MQAMVVRGRKRRGKKGRKGELGRVSGAHGDGQDSCTADVREVGQLAMEGCEAGSDAEEVRMRRKRPTSQKKDRLRITRPPCGLSRGDRRKGGSGKS